MTEDVQTEAVETPAVQLQISDLIVLMNVVRITAERGAIRAEEMQVVGGVYDKLVRFLDAAGALKTAEQATAEETQGE